MDRAWKGLLKSGIIFLTLSLFVYIFYHIDFLEFQRTPNPPFKKIRGSSDPGSNQNYCTFRPLSPKEIDEENTLLNSIAWPNTPSVPLPVSLNDTSNAARSNFVILPRPGGGSWLVGDQLEVMIKMFDFKGRPKTHGGDFFLVRLHNRTVEAGVAGQVVDHLNGTYSAVFLLPWEGKSQIEVTLVHPSEAIPFLQRFAGEKPNGVDFYSTFHSGLLTQKTMCSVCLPPTQQPQCNYTDLNTGELWFCYKPQNLSCDARINHFSIYQNPPKAKEDILFKNGVTMNVGIPASGPAHVTVFPKMKGELAATTNKDIPGPAGYYYKGLWSSLSGATVKRFNNASAISQCLKDKVVHMYGDSTVRQWLEFLSRELSDLKVYNLHNMKQSGPYVALDYARNIFVTYRCHGLPIRIVPSPVTELHYVANELDGITGGKTTVVVFGVWAHFTTFPIKYYIRRLMSIRKAVVRLLARAPATRIIIRTANLKNSPSPFSAQLGGDWPSLQRDKILRTMFKGMDVYFVDAWEMTVAHYLKHDIHPPRPIIKNMIDVVLSYICPSK
ncbi:NXPE family member 3-like isoform X2 [Salarias fasciatus]|uniref:NXPE family member 3-like n=2 Tax=Salarias fasciatus TaxID=181472 RepID=A0A672H0N0_SALFA|nr:NXPE family member 3-like isoform X2 [Salarias fasciatus]XP_029969174.1 NXPE family member 3-like isoform X2 [Salarias fasciatus]XP_029969175.1 NXPE family member 3-like isoform X2 [Salarias fasciatus]XP_029969176.1 NXPE family member 3-like isoform X2 [Salarias fasciatus]